MEQQLEQAKQADSLAEMNGWKQGLGRNEIEQTLADFKMGPETQQNIHRKHLKIVIFGEISLRDRQILEIVSDYLQAVHGLDTTLDPIRLDLYKAHIRHNPHPQYPVENHLGKIKSLLPENTFSIGFTDQDLYPYFDAGRIKFIFG